MRSATVSGRGRGRCRPPRYVKSSLEPWLLASAALLVLLALTSIVRDVRRGPHAGAHDDHGHLSGVIWLLILPVALLAFVVLPAIGPQAARPTVTEVSTEVLRRPFPQLPQERAPELSLPDLLIRNAQDSAGTLNNRLVTVTGFTMRDGDRLALGRIVILCCAADAQLAQITIGGPAAARAAGLPEGSWVRVEGIVPADRVIRRGSRFRRSISRLLSRSRLRRTPTRTDRLYDITREHRAHGGVGLASGQKGPLGGVVAPQMPCRSADFIASVRH